MKPVDASVGAWIGPRLRPRATILGVIPTGFERYVRVLHPVDVEGDRVVRWCDVAAVTGRVVHPLVQWWRLIGSEDAMNPSSDLWLAGEPTPGELEQPDNQVLLDLLAHHTHTPEQTYFAVWLGFAAFHHGATVRFGSRRSEVVDVSPMADLLARGSVLRHPGREYGVMTGSLEEAATIPALLGPDFPGPSANIVWPRDRSWCVATEVDFDSTLVGCSAEAADVLLSDSRLETFRISTADSLAYDADVVNIRRRRITP